MTKGQMTDLNKIEMYARLDTSFRIITDYQSITDQILTRIDVKIGNEQYNVAFCSGTPIEPQSGNKILPQDDLITPKEGVLSCLNLKVSRTELIRALKELLADIDK